MDNFVAYIGWVICIASAVAVCSGVWFLALRLLWCAVRETAVAAIFVRWWMIKYIRSVRRDKRKAVARHVAHTQKAKLDAS